MASQLAKGLWVVGSLQGLLSLEWVFDFFLQHSRKRTALSNCIWELATKPRTGSCPLQVLEQGGERPAVRNCFFFSFFFLSVPCGFCLVQIQSYISTVFLSLPFVFPQKGSLPSVPTLPILCVLVCNHAPMVCHFVPVSPWRCFCEILARITGI